MLHGKASSLMKIYARILGVVYIAVLLPTCLCPRICLSYFFSVFNFYIGCIGQEIKACLGSTHMDTASKLEVVEQCRSLLHSIRSWVRETAVILGPGLLYTYGYAAGLFCASVVYCILPGVKPLIKFFFLGSGVMHFVSLLVPTVIAHRFAYKVLMLLNTLKQEDYLFNVNSYFNVNLETFTSIIGAALMYTVFLVQTTKPLVEEDSNP
ncbi:uncharacterized protein LOC144142989 [Haemaphysalis longicornis]